ncbi:hypothetical protein EYF80_024798 [Liparis tanakae]|uniref:Uncharacterized protein n=1 Tax=Liparis tanakae TaxID=230148 RepID=A0A4Z2HJ03_9TELE|nr:hypothetical protein EYF80_024798 [Liparis tanakae]
MPAPLFHNRPAAALSSVREYLWFPSLSKHSMVRALGVAVRNAFLRPWWFSPGERRPTPSRWKTSSKELTPGRNKRLGHAASAFLLERAGAAKRGRLLV